MKAAKTSAGLLLFRRTNAGLEFLLVHPGGPFFKKKDLGHWSIPKGEAAAEEDLLTRAKIEFEEELGIPVSGDDFIPLGWIRQKGGKIVHAWALEGDLPTSFAVNSNLFELEWPPRSGRRQTFPEVDKAEFFPEAIAREKIKETQIPLLDRLREIIR
ncbi:MAG: NUDIX domain-containing protein [Chthoniobacterales bacterium]